MPKILIYKKTLMLLLVAFLSSILANSTKAQCVVKRSHKGNTITAELPDTYIYQRTNNEYNSVAVMLSETKKGAITTTAIRIKYSFSNILKKAGSLSITLSNGEIIKFPLTLTRASRTDNKNIYTNTYVANLQNDIADKLLTNPAASIEISSGINYKFSETFTVDPALFMQMLKCLKDPS